MKLVRKAAAFADNNQEVTTTKEDGGADPAEPITTRQILTRMFRASGGRVTRSAKECEPIVNVPRSEFPWKVETH